MVDEGPPCVGWWEEGRVLAIGPPLLSVFLYSSVLCRIFSQFFVLFLLVINWDFQLRSGGMLDWLPMGLPRDNAAWGCHPSESLQKYLKSITRGRLGNPRCARYWSFLAGSQSSRRLFFALIGGGRLDGGVPCRRWRMEIESGGRLTLGSSQFVG